MSALGKWVGREQELAVLDGAIGRLCDRTGGVLSVCGEPGIGKSRLLAEAGRMAEARGALLLEGQATELERDFPFGVVVDALDPYLASLPSVLLRTLGEDQRRLLALVFPALAKRESHGTLVPEERFRCHRAVRELLGVLAAQRPVVLALDDLQWADPASLELLDHLLRRPPSAPILLLLAHREGFSPGPVERIVDRIELTPLSVDEAAMLLGSDLAPEVRARVYDESGGNPFHLEHLARALSRVAHESPGPASGEPLDVEVPRPVREALSHELDALSERTRRVLQAAAVGGDPFTPELVAEIAEEELLATRTAIDQAIAVRLVRSADTPVLFRFRHPIVRRAVYASAGLAWRSGAHARAAVWLGGRGASALARAHHVERSALPGDEEAVAVLTAAGQAAASMAPATAARWFESAVRLLPESADESRRLALLGPLAAALGSAGRLRESRAMLFEILDTLPIELVGARGRLIGFTAVIDRLLGQHGSARELLEQTLRTVPDPDCADAAGLELELAADRFFRGDWSAMLEHAERGWNGARRAGSEGMRATAASLLGLAQYSVGAVKGGRERRAEAARIVDGALADGRDPRLDALDWLGWLELSIEEYDAALGHFARGLETGRRTGGGHLLATMSFGLVLTCTWSGRLAEAFEHSDATLELGRLTGSDQVLSWAHGLRCLVELRSGALADALDHGAQAHRLGDGTDANPFSAVSRGWFGEALIEAGQPVRGREEILRALGGPELPGVESPFRPFFYDVLARAEVAGGRREAAGEWARAAQAAATGLELHGRTGSALHAAALAEPDPAVGARLALQAAESLGHSHPIEAARARTLAGRHLGAAGDRRAALEQLQRSTAELTALGARHYSAQAIRERRRLGERLARGGHRPTATTGLAALSKREREVAALIQERLTNREIAQRLVLSEKTVERHLSRIFFKLDARTRVDVARALAATAPS